MKLSGLKSPFYVRNRGDTFTSDFSLKIWKYQQLQRSGCEAEWSRVPISYFLVKCPEQRGHTCKCFFLSQNKLEVLVKLSGTESPSQNCSEQMVQNRDILVFLFGNFSSIGKCQDKVEVLVRLSGLESPFSKLSRHQFSLGKTESHLSKYPKERGHVSKFASWHLSFILKQNILLFSNMKLSKQKCWKVEKRRRLVSQKLARVCWKV